MIAITIGLLTAISTVSILYGYFQLADNVKVKRENKRLKNQLKRKKDEIVIIRQELSDRETELRVLLNKDNDE